MKYIDRIRNSKNGRTVAKNFGYLSILEMCTHFFPLITTPYLARVIGVDGFGALAVGSAIIAYFQTFTNYGFNLSAVREIARKREDISAISDIVSRTLCAKVFLMLVSFSIVLVLTYTVPYFIEYKMVILCTFSIIPGTVLFADWFFQAIEDMKYITIMNLASRFIFTISVFLVIHDADDFLWQPILTGIGYTLPALISLCFMKKRYNVKFMLVSFSVVWGEIKNGFNLFISLFLPSIYSNLNILLLGAYNGKGATGIYSGGIRFTTIAFSFFQVLSRAIYPYFARDLSKHKFYVMLSLGLSILMTAFLFIFAAPIVHIFLGSQFEDTVIVLRILAFTPIAMSLMNSYGFNYLILQGGERQMRNIIVFVTILGLSLGIPMAIYYSFIGVAITELTIQSIRAILITVVARHLKKRNNNGK